MVKINDKLLPIKAHYFFFMAAMGPILPQLSVIGKQLGVSAEVMGYIITVLPILYVLAKPLIGFLADYFSNFRKTIFVSLILIMTLCYAGFYFVPTLPEHQINEKSTWNFNGSFLNTNLIQCENQTLTAKSICTKTRKIICTEKEWKNHSSPSIEFFMTKDSFESSYNICIKNSTIIIDVKSEFSCRIDIDFVTSCIYDPFTFWIFVTFLIVGTIGFNITNCISDAICFDVLGDKEEMKYGVQRVWGTIGFGVTALMAGIIVDMSAVQNIIPALIIMTIFSGLDLLSVIKLKLPKLSISGSLAKEVGKLMCQPSILIFLCFAVLAGIFDSIIIVFMFWHLEDLAKNTGYMEQIKLIEGCVVAAECLCGEIPMFLYSGKIIKKLGYIHCLSMCFLLYSVRLGLISIISDPWYLVPIEMVMQGCTYALCYTCIVAYASAIAPPGTSATVQGLVAGMDDGLGFAIGSFTGGQLMQRFGGQITFQIYAGIALLTCFAHIILRPKHKIDMQQQQEIASGKDENVTPAELQKLNEKT